MNNNFILYGILNSENGKLVSDITNPRHKYWEKKGSAQSALNGGTARHAYRSGKYKPENLKVVEIECTVKND